MFTYQIRPRIFRVLEGNSFPFPNPATIKIVLSPVQAFGVEAPGGRTITAGTGAFAIFDSNTGIHFAERKTPLTPVEIKVKEPGKSWVVNGNEFVLNVDHCESLEELTILIQSLYFGLPVLLNSEFAEPPVIDRIEGKVGEIPFRWELSEWRMDFELTSRESQEQKFFDAWQRFSLISEPGNRRLLGALHYFHRASRLAVSGQSPWEFMAECILNFSKTLEVLFPPSSRDAVRDGLRQLDYTTEEIERDFIPSMSLRAAIDVGHVNLAIYTRKQLSIIHRYTEEAEKALRKMLSRLMDKMAEGTFALDQYQQATPGKAAQQVLAHLEEHYGDPSLTEIE